MPLSDFGVFLATPTDLLRLVVVPVFAWIAWTDIKTRRIPNRVWLPLIVFGAGLLAWDTWSVWGTLDWQFFAASAGVSLFVVIPAAYLMWAIGGFGGADAKAIMTLSVLFPTYPAYFVGADSYPLVDSAIGSFSFTILANAVVVTMIAPVGLLVLNLLRRDVGPVMFLGRIRRTSSLTEIPGKLLQTKDGFTRSGLDLDVLRMYLRWRGVRLDQIRSVPEAYRHPDTVSEPTYDPTDGAVHVDAEPDGDDRAVTIDADKDDVVNIDIPGKMSDVPEDERDATDWWAAEEFLKDAGHAYGVTSEEISRGLEVLVSEDEVWVSPGTPFMVPVLGGLLIGLIYGNLLFVLLRLIGVV